jgi:alpha-L-rhamnosidase
MKITSATLRLCIPKVAIMITCLSLLFTSKAQVIDSTFLVKQWKARWITVPQTNPTGYGVYYFRKSFELTSIPKIYPVHVSADNRYKLFVNEKLVSVGPARGDLQHWNFETIDLAPFLRMGHNIVAAQVWNEGEQRMEANISLRTGFILQGGTDEAQELNTKNTWKCLQDSSYSPIKIVIPTYYVAGPGEQVEMQRHIRGWEKLTYVDSNWKQATAFSFGYPKNKVGSGEPTGWLLVPSPLPQMELKQQRLAQLRRSEGITVPASFPATKTAITIPPNTEATLLLDQEVLTNAYPTVIFSGGRNSTITLRYEEALYTKYPAKGNRNEIEGKKLVGRKDSITSDGSQNQTFTTLSWRTYRYVQINITTKETPLVLEDIYGTFTGYPFVLNAKLETDNVEMKKMLDIGWRTARLCASETYMDCPYYEQLQYIGDMRIQGLVSLYNSGDDRLLRNAINQIDYSRQPEGLTLSRYPTSNPQYITPFSLWYIGMLHDYMMYGNDSSFIKNKLMGARQILNYFKGFQQQDGSLRNLPGWNFTDWVDVKNWPVGTRSPGKDGNSALIDLQLLWAYQVAADLEQRIGMKDYAALYKQNEEQLKKTIRKKYWDSTKNLFADRSEKDLFSQHANSLAILTGLVSGNEAARIGKQLLSDTTLAPASIYFKYYLHLALVKAGLGNDYLHWLGKWRENMAMGLTTWAETSDLNTTRSDCHAWGASPNIEFFRTILGIDSDAPGFTKVSVEPHLGTIKAIGGEMPHPSGKIRVMYHEGNGHLNAEIDLPLKTTGKFVWKGKSYALKEGKNSIKI